MLLNSIKMQLLFFLERKIATLVFFLLFCLVLVNFFHNVITYKGSDLFNMYHPMTLLTLSSFSEYCFYLLQYYPIIVVIPAGFSLFNDKRLNQYIYIVSRVGVKNYYIGKLISVFFVTFLVFTLPFLLEIVLNCIAFPMDAVGEPSNYGFYTESYVAIITKYIFSSLYIQSPYLYAIFFTLVFGILSGVLAMFTVAISTFPIKFKVLLFLPVYVLLHGLAMVKQSYPSISFDTNYFFYLGLYNPVFHPKENLIAYFAFIIVVFCLSIFIVLLKMRKDAI